MEGEGQCKDRSQIYNIMCASDHLQDRDKVNSNEEVNPPLPVEELYTAVKKKPKGSYSSVQVNEPVSKAAEDLYTAVMKKPKENSVNEVAPSSSPHTIEELYTAVHRNPKGNTIKDEEEVPPIPLPTAEDTY